MQGILAVRLEEGDVSRTSCPAVGCVCRLPLRAAQQLLGSRQARERYEQLLAQSYADANPAVKWCALPLLDAGNGRATYGSNLRPFRSTPLRHGSFDALSSSQVSGHSLRKHSAEVAL